MITLIFLSYSQTVHSMQTKNRLLLLLNSLFCPRHSPLVNTVSSLSVVLCTTKSLWYSALLNRNRTREGIWIVRRTGDTVVWPNLNREGGSAEEGERTAGSRCPITSLNFPGAELVLLLKCACSWSSCCTCIL